MVWLDEFEWHKITSAEVEGSGYEIILDVSEDQVPDQAAEYRGVLVRTTKAGWSWYARTTGGRKKDVPYLGETGTADTKDQAIEDGFRVIDHFRAKTKLMSR